MAVENAPDEHARPQTPQFAVSRVTSASQPSDADMLQSPRPALHANPQVPDPQIAVAPVRAGQALPHVPQLATALASTTSHPSAGTPLQSANPARQSSRHVPAVHVGVPLGPDGH